MLGGVRYCVFGYLVFGILLALIASVAHRTDAYADPMTGVNRE